MRRSTLNFLIDVISFAVFLGMIATGLLIRFVLPPGSRGGKGLSLWDLDRHEWGDLHFWLAITLFGLLLVHLVLHWSWVCQVARTIIKAPAVEPASRSAAKRTAIGVSILAGCMALVAAFLFLAGANVVDARAERSSYPEFQRGPRAERQSDDGPRARGGQQRRERRGSRQP